MPAERRAAARPLRLLAAAAAAEARHAMPRAASTLRRAPGQSALPHASVSCITQDVLQDKKARGE